MNHKSSYRRHSYEYCIHASKTGAQYPLKPLNDQSPNFRDHTKMGNFQLKCIQLDLARQMEQLLVIRESIDIAACGSYGCASQKGKAVYLYLHYANQEGFITIPNCDEKFTSAVLLGSDTPLAIEYKGRNIIVHGTPMPEYNKIPVIKLERP